MDFVKQTVFLPIPVTTPNLIDKLCNNIAIRLEQKIINKSEYPNFEPP